MKQNLLPENPYRNTKREAALCVLLFLFVLFFGIWLLIRTPDRVSLSERRVLAQIEEISFEEIKSGEATEMWESYAQDQFPLRDAFRGFKTWNELEIFRKMDSDGLFFSQGHLSRVSYEVSEPSLARAAEVFSYLYETYLKEWGIQPSLVIVPDKNAFLSENDIRPVLDEQKIRDAILEDAGFFNVIEIRGLLWADAYYFTDTHWRQECLSEVAGHILEEMDAPGNKLFKAEETEILTVDAPFWGVYAGQAALRIKPDVMRYVWNAELKDCRVTDYGNGYPVEIPMYDMVAAKGRDAYEMFLGGASPLVVIENPKASTNRELVMFRDSFGSSIAPWFAGRYRKITLVDTRYIHEGKIGEYVSFENADVLFLYSTIFLNQCRKLVTIQDLHS